MRMNEILNGIIVSNMAGGAIFCAISVQQTQAVEYNHFSLTKNEKYFHFLGKRTLRSGFYHLFDHCYHFVTRHIAVLLCGNHCFWKHTNVESIDVQYGLVQIASEISTLYQNDVNSIAEFTRTFGLWSHQLFTGNSTKGKLTIFDFIILRRKLVYLFIDWRKMSFSGAADGWITVCYDQLVLRIGFFTALSQHIPSKYEP